MSRHGGGGYEELDYELNNPVSVWRPEYAGVLVPEGTKESLLEAATATTDEHGQRYCVHGVYLGYAGGPDFMCSLCEIGEDPKHLHEETEDGTYCHETDSWIEGAPGASEPIPTEDNGRCLCGHLDDDHDDACTVWDCECANFETDGIDLNAEAEEDDHDNATGLAGCGSCGADLGPSESFVWHMPEEDCRAVREPIKLPTDDEDDYKPDPESLPDSALTLCRYCRSVRHRSSAWTANGSDLDRFERVHRNEDGKRPGGPSF